MKRKLLFILLVTLLCLSLTGCASILDQVLSSIPQAPTEGGLYQSKVYEEFFEYGKYTFDRNVVAGNQYFVPYEEVMARSFREHYDHWENWLQKELPGSNLTANYDFSIDLLTSDDYLYICDDWTYRHLGNYYIFLFDTATNTLYYFHYNV